METKIQDETCREPGLIQFIIVTRLLYDGRRSSAIRFSTSPDCRCMPPRAEELKRHVGPRFNESVPRILVREIWIRAARELLLLWSKVGRELDPLLHRKNTKMF